MKKAVIIIIGIWLFIIGFFVFSQELTLHTGKEVLLRTIPVDPRDLLRGDYVILNYEISQIPPRYNFQANKTVYVILKTDKNNIAEISDITEQRPSGVLYLKGKTNRCETIIPLFRSGRCIKYGIESYFVKEGTGKELEKNLRNGAVVKVVIDKNGKAKVKGFLK